MEDKQRGKVAQEAEGGGHQVDLDEDDDLEEFRLPMSHRPTENLDTEGLEQASVHTQLTASNVGFRLLQKMGWKTGKGLGKNEQGILEPIRADMRDAKLGVGKQEEDDFFTSEENVQRKKLNIELEETEEHIKKREVIAEREHKIRSEVKEIQKVFFCSLCNKQYKLAHEFESHLSSYDHNHRKRFKEMREMQSSSGSRDDRQKREQQREEKELAKIAQLADAHRKQQQQLKQEKSETPAESAAPKSMAAPSNQDQRRTLKFGFSKMTPSKFARHKAAHNFLAVHVALAKLVRKSGGRKGSRTEEWKKNRRLSSSRIHIPAGSSGGGGHSKHPSGHGGAGRSRKGAVMAADLERE